MFDADVRNVDTSNHEDFTLFATGMINVNPERLRSLRELILPEALQNRGDDLWALRHLNGLLGDLPVYNGQPPADLAVLDEHLPDAPYLRMDLPIKKTASQKVIGRTDLIRHVYQVAGWMVFLYWPKGEDDPGPNRLDILPKCEYGTGGGQPK